MFSVLGHLFKDNKRRYTNTWIYQKHSHDTIKQPRENKVYVMLAVYVNAHVWINKDLMLGHSVR